MERAPSVSSPPQDPAQRSADLQAQLAAVTRREAEFRAKMIQEFLDRGERNTYLHTLRAERAALVVRQHESFADLENLVRKLEAEGERSAALEAQLGAMCRSWSWRLTSPLRSLARAFSAGASPSTLSRVMDRAPVEGGIFTYFLHTSPFRVYRDASFTLRGWAWPQDGRAITGIRVNLSGRTFVGRRGLEEPEVIAKHGDQPANPRPGFEVTFETPPGKQTLSLEAQLDGAEWRWIVRTSIWCEPTET
ncbi:MAG TPA: hypothetical protein VII09_00900 [Opitutaceae bacterium]